ncbi:MAG: phage Gp37/Gp68 family protein [Chloroflexaceae bacterium]|nr:phage Gp37/Gp68 family protein [Chloroflexaceae bacterium]
MAQYSPIEWCDHTFNPWWGCTRVSPGCQHCYAETWARRYRYEVWGKQTSRRLFGEQHWREPLKWNEQAHRQGRRIRVFCASMADVFEDHPDIVSERQKLWQLIEATPMLDWLLLTKRTEHMRQMVPRTWFPSWPRNVWAMTSVENQKQAARRIPLLLDIPATVHGLSVEPLIASVDLVPWLAHIQWVIVGGESGPNARPMSPDWVRRLRDQCQQFGVAFFFKQWGSYSPLERGNNGTYRVEFQHTGKKSAGRLLDGRTWDEFPDVLFEGMWEGTTDEWAKAESIGSL